jgi:hypothetical protein
MSYVCALVCMHVCMCAHACVRTCVCIDGIISSAFESFYFHSHKKKMLLAFNI